LHALLHRFDLFFVVAVGGGLALGVFLLGFALIFGGTGFEGFGLTLLDVGHVGWEVVVEGCCTGRGIVSNAREDLRTAVESQLESKAYLLDSRSRNAKI
jgi:hypothetical protein